MHLKHYLLKKNELSATPQKAHSVPLSLLLITVKFITIHLVAKPSNLGIIIVCSFFYSSISKTINKISLH